MTELQLARGATKWLRSFGLAAVGLLLAGVMAITSFLSAQSAADGSDSEVDYAATLSSTGNQLGATYSSLPQPTYTNPYSVQLWVNPGSLAANNPTGNDRVLINMEHKFVIMSRANTWQYYIGNGSSWASGLIDTGVTVRQGQWTHIGLVLTATDTHFYVNGQHVHSRGSRQDSGGIVNKYLDLGPQPKPRPWHSLTARWMRFGCGKQIAVAGCPPICTPVQPARHQLPTGTSIRVLEAWCTTAMAPPTSHRMFQSTSKTSSAPLM
jgi:hypothetical protein